MKRVVLVLVVAATVAGGLLFGRPGPTDDRGVPSVVVTTSMLESAVRELVEPGEVRVVRLLPPGACPGHFDLSPRRLPEIKGASLVLRHPFQEPLARQLKRLGVDPDSIVVVGSEQSLLLPRRYLRLVQTVARRLANLPALNTDVIEQRSSALAHQLKQLHLSLDQRSRGWRGVPVIASSHQAEFCQRLGLRVIGKLDRPEDTDPRNLEQLLSLRPDLVVGNLQEGTRAAATIAQRLDVPLGVLSAFPNVEGWPAGYSGLLDGNVSRLEQALDLR